MAEIKLEGGPHYCFCGRMLSHHWVELFERIIRIKRYNLIGGCMSLGMGFEVSKVQAQVLFLYRSEGSSQLLLQDRVYPP